MCLPVVSSLSLSMLTLPNFFLPTTTVLVPITTFLPPSTVFFPTTSFLVTLVATLMRFGAVLIRMAGVSSKLSSSSSTSWSLWMVIFIFIWSFWVLALVVNFLTAGALITACTRLGASRLRASLGARVARPEGLLHGSSPAAGTGAPMVRTLPEFVLSCPFEPVAPFAPFWALLGGL